MDEQQKVLARYRRWLIAVARELAPTRPHEWQDLAQEGWIAMWRALRTFDSTKGAEATYLTTAARLRMLDVLRRHTWLGTPAARGHVRELPATPVDTSWDWVDAQSQYVENHFEDALWAYHHGEIADALSQLSAKDRAYVEHRIMGDGGRYGWREAVLSQQASQILRAGLEHLVAETP